MNKNISNWLGKYSHLLLAGVFGIIAIAEAIRVGVKYTSESFIAGPGGYMMVVGAGMVCFSLMGAIAGLWGWLRRDYHRLIRKSDLVPASLPDVQLESEESGKLPINSSRLWKTCLSFLLCIVYVILIKPLGFTIASLLYLAINLWLLQNPVRRILVTCIVMFPILSFCLPLVGISVPKGIFGV